MGAAALVIEYDISAVAAIGDDVYVLHQGKLLAQGTLAEIPVRSRGAGGVCGDAEMSGISLSFEKLVCGYGDTMVLRGLSGVVGPGRVLAACWAETASAKPP